MSLPFSPATKSASLAALCALMLGVFPSSVWALYKVVGPDGRVTYSDQPPEGGVHRSLDVPVSNGSGDASLPYALKQAVDRYPVVLYTTAGCTPCDSGRALLRQRGVPFHERTVGSASDQDALRKISGNSSLPVLQVGGKTVSGFQGSQWNGYLSAAGYPATSMLPANYRAPGATPLTSQAPAAAPAPAAETTPAARPASPAAVPANSNPAGIRF